MKEKWSECQVMPSLPNDLVLEGLYPCIYDPNNFPSLISSPNIKHYVKSKVHQFQPESDMFLTAEEAEMESELYLALVDTVIRDAWVSFIFFMLSRIQFILMMQDIHELYGAQKSQKHYSKIRNQVFSDSKNCTIQFVTTL